MCIECLLFQALCQASILRVLAHLIFRANWEGQMSFLWHFQMKVGDRCPFYGIFSWLMFYHHMKDMKYSCPNILWKVCMSLCKVEIGWANWPQVSKNLLIMRTQLPILFSALDTKISWPDGFIFKYVWPCFSKHWVTILCINSAWLCLLCRKPLQASVMC